MAIGDKVRLMGLWRRRAPNGTEYLQGKMGLFLILRIYPGTVFEGPRSEEREARLHHGFFTTRSWVEADVEVDGVPRSPGEIPAREAAAASGRVKKWWSNVVAQQVLDEAATEPQRYFQAFALEPRVTS